MKDFRRFAISVAKEAGTVLLENHGKLKDLTWKTRTHFKTNIDDQSDVLIRKRITQAYPEHSIFSEEGRDLDTGSEYKWVFDPLDGTIPYTLGLTDHFSVSITLVKGKIPILGVIYAPKRQEFYVAKQGIGAFCNGQRIQVSNENDISNVVMGLDSGKETESFKRSSIGKYCQKTLSPDGIGCFVCSGCATVPLCLVAKGNLHAYMALSLEPWDMAAAVIINREAGAKVTTNENKEWKLGDESILAANHQLHGKLLKHFGVST